MNLLHRKLAEEEAVLVAQYPQDGLYILVAEQAGQVLGGEKVPDAEPSIALERGMRETSAVVLAARITKSFPLGSQVYVARILAGEIVELKYVVTVKL